MTEQPQIRKDLSDLVRNRRAELHLSLRAVEALTTDKTGEPIIKYGWLNKLEKGLDVIPPDLSQLRALADSLEVSLGEVQEAAGSQFLGIDTVWSEDGEVRALVHDYREMDPEDQAKARALMQSWRKLKHNP